jgi:hypothetical protein
MTTVPTTQAGAVALANWAISIMEGREDEEDMIAAMRTSRSSSRVGVRPGTGLRPFIHGTREPGPWKTGRFVKVCFVNFALI